MPSLAEVKKRSDERINSHKKTKKKRQARPWNISHPGQDESGLNSVAKEPIRKAAVSALSQEDVLNIGEVDEKIQSTDNFTNDQTSLRKEYYNVGNAVKSAAHSMHYFILRTYTNSGLLSMSMEDISKNLRLTEGAARSTMKSLREAGLIIVEEEQTSKSPRVYRLTV